MTSPSGTRGARANHSTYMGLGTPGVCASGSEIGAVLQAFPGHLESFTIAVEPLLQSHELRVASLAVRRAGESAAWYHLSMSNHLRWLVENDFSREDARQIRYLVEAFYKDEPTQTIIAALAFRLAQGTEASFRESITLDFQDPDQVFHHILADWPEYRAKVAYDMAGSVLIGDYEHAVLAVRRKAWEMAAAIPIDHGFTHGNPELAGSIAERLERSCEVVALACALRRMFIRAETTARRES